MTTYRALVVEDEPVAAEANAAYLRRLDVEVVAVAATGQEALRYLAGDPDVDLILLDMHLKDGHGLALLRRIRAAGHSCDVIAVTSARDVDVVRQAVAQGVVSYLIKPFTFAGFRTKLEQYVRYREQMAASGTLGQSDVDSMLATLRPTLSSTDLPKGLTMSTLTRVSATVREAERAMSASELAELIGASRVTARRYLEHLADSGLLERDTRFGRTGRPEVEYRWRESRRS
ncbi:MAG TPA: response regulator [Propionibacteriaceae bacterium]|jgi:response regulator of citrate/malate metabolism|nr:response regulator [Propionibacteriaceae bacterium]